jgi:hypoxanthine-DNA glycosylase
MLMKNVHADRQDVTGNDTCIGLDAQFDARTRVLVLGSMPGVASLREARYYAHPRNRFWPLMSLMCGVDATLPYAAKLAALNDAGIGLWDVIGQCRRRGSLDADIVRGSEVPNPIAALLATLPALRLVACNGAAAHRAFQRFIVPDIQWPLRAPVLALPSTSPANAAASLEALRQAWLPVTQALDGGV